jgi:hypothetical protein
MSIVSGDYFNVLHFIAGKGLINSLQWSSAETYCWIIVWRPTVVLYNSLSHIKLCPEIHALLHAFDQLDVLHTSTHSRQDSNVFNTVLYGDEITNLLNSAALDLT